MTQSSVQRISFTIKPVPPYDFDLTADFATYFRGRYLWEFYENGTYRRLLEIDGTLAIAAVKSIGSVEDPGLEVEIAGSHLDTNKIQHGQRQIQWILQTNLNLAAFYHMAEADPFLKTLVKSHRGFHVPQGPSVFEGLISTILGQQISGQVARTLRALLMENYGESLAVDGSTFFAFPKPEALVAAGIEGLRNCKISGRKSEYIIDIAAAVVEGQIDLEAMYHKADAEVIETLTRLRGIGIWTAQWLLVRTLGRPDGFPHGDLALQKRLGDLVNAGVRLTGEEALEYSLRWSPYRTYVTAYIFGAIRKDLQSARTI